MRVAEGERAAIDLELCDGLSIGGIVLDPAGNPLADVFVQAIGASGGNGVAARSRADGTFELGSLQRGRYTLSVQDLRAMDTGPGGFGPIRVPDVEAGTHGLELRLPAMIPARGRVIDDAGAPVSMAVVSFRTMLLDADVRSSSASDGRFALDLPDGAAVHVVVQRTEPMPGDAAQRRVARPGTFDLELDWVCTRDELVLALPKRTD